MLSTDDLKEMGRRIPRALTLAAVGLALWACHAAPPVEGPFGVPSAPQRAEDLQTFVILDPQLVGRISVDRHGVQRDPNGRLAVQVFVRNRTQYPQAIDVQTAFRDEQGFDINDTTAWERLSLEPNATAAYRAVSLDSRAARYVVRFREGM